MSNKIIVAFHIGRGGPFWNPGHRTYIGEKTFQDLIILNERYLYYYENDGDVQYIEPGYYDCSGNLMVTKKESEKETGRIEIDGQYDTDYCKYINDCTEDELELIRIDTAYKSFELEQYLKEYFIDEEN